MVKQTTSFKAVRLLPLIFFAWLYASSHLFMHAHQINNVWVVHSHIGTNNHQHSTASLQTIHFLSHFDAAGNIGLPTMPNAYIWCWQLLFDPELQQLLSTDMQANLLRGPPAQA